MPREKNLQFYTQKFAKLRQGVTRYGPAPHKPVLLLAVMQGIENGLIRENRIELTPELVAIFKSIWSRIVDTGHQPLIAQPFFYMRSEKFWHHVAKPGFEEWVRISKNCNSIGVLRNALAYVKLDDELFLHLSDPVSRELLRRVLFETYFKNNSPDSLAMYPNYMDQLMDKCVAEDPEEYRAEVLRLKETLDKESFEEEVFVRSGAFKKELLKVYDNTCCISGLRVETLSNASLIDACHIVQFAESHDDTISNGFCLCPNLHRAFDRGLIAVDDHFRVIVASQLHEPVNSPYSIAQFDGKQIHLPEKQIYYPGRVNFREHRKKWRI